jgi:hypothetical protein
MSRFINPAPQFFIGGEVASSAKMKFYENKDYSTLKDTFSQPDNTSANTNPLSLDGDGRMPPCFGSGTYSVKLFAYDPDVIGGVGTLEWTRDDVVLSELTGQFSNWSGLNTYAIGDITKASDSFYYRSFNSGNIGHDPTTSPTFWEKMLFITAYNPNRNYLVDDNVISGGHLYRSNVTPNINHTPPSSQWDDLSFNSSITGNFTASGNITAGGSVTAASYVGGSLSKTTDNGIVKTAFKAASTSRASTTTPAADPDLVCTGLTGTTYYAFEAMLLWDGQGSTTNGLKAEVVSSSGVVYVDFVLANTNTTSANATPTANELASSALPFSKLPNFSGATEAVILKGLIKTSSAGTIYVQWAQAASVATNTRVQVGSYLTVTKLG